MFNSWRNHAKEALNPLCLLFFKCTKPYFIPLQLLPQIMYNM